MATPSQTPIPFRSFSEVADTLQDAVVVTDRLGRVVWVNRAFTELCGHSAEEMTGKRPGHVLQGGYSDPKVVDRLRTAVREGRPVKADIVNYHKDGHPYWASISISPIRTARGRLEGFVAIECDTTDRNSETRQLENEVVSLYSAVLTVEGREW